jgi:hypothetical protein
MGTRGRRSAADIAMDQFLMKAARRPDPPRDLDAAEATEWREIVASLPADYFAHYPLQIVLGLWCRHTVAARQVSKLLADCRNKNKLDREHKMLLKAQQEESAMILKLQRALRLTHQTVYRADSAKQRPALGPPLLFKPWNRQQ